MASLPGLGNSLFLNRVRRGPYHQNQDLSLCLGQHVKHNILSSSHLLQATHSKGDTHNKAATPNQEGILNREAILNRYRLQIHHKPCGHRNCLFDNWKRLRTKWSESQGCLDLHIIAIAPILSSLLAMSFLVLNNTASIGLWWSWRISSAARIWRGKLLCF